MNDTKTTDDILRAIASELDLDDHSFEAVMGRIADWRHDRYRVSQDERRRAAEMVRDVANEIVDPLLVDESTDLLWSLADKIEKGGEK